jgi:prolyl 4-hydroxylase
MSNVVLSNSSIGLLLFENVMAPIECASVMHLTERHLKSKAQPDLVRNDGRPSPARRYMTAGIDPEHSISALLDARLCELLNFQLSEQHTPWRVLRYQAGDFFPPHHDRHFLPSADDTRHMTTFLVYLNGDYEGGKTVFPEITTTIPAKQGRGLMWQSATRGKENPLAIHASTKITRGEKWVLVKWFVR